MYGVVRAASVYKVFSGNMWRQVLIVLITKYILAESAFIPGRGCGIFNKITIIDSAANLKEGETCVLILGREDLSFLKEKQLGELPPGIKKIIIIIRFCLQPSSSVGALRFRTGCSRTELGS